MFQTGEGRNSQEVKKDLPVNHLPLKNCKMGTLKFTAKALGKFYILVKLLGGSLQVKNELTYRHFVRFC